MAVRKVRAIGRTAPEALLRPVMRLTPGIDPDDLQFIRRYAVFPNARALRRIPVRVRLPVRLRIRLPVRLAVLRSVFAVAGLAAGLVSGLVIVGYGRRDWTTVRDVVGAHLAAQR